MMKRGQWKIPMVLPARLRHSVSSSEDDSDDGYGGDGGARRHAWPKNWSRKESQFTGSYPIWKNHFGLKEEEWMRVGFDKTAAGFFPLNIILISAAFIPGFTGGMGAP